MTKIEVKNRKIIEIVKKLDLLEGEYAVFGSALLDVLGLRESGDVDLILTKKLFEELARREDWEKFTYENNGDEALKYQGDFVDVAFYYCNYFPGCDEAGILGMIKDAAIIEGVNFVSLEDTLKWKRAAGREKDLRDVGMIEGYLGRGGK